MRGAAGILAGLLMLGACSDKADKPESGSGAGTPTAAQGTAPECALAGSGEWRNDCAMERDGALLTIRHPDGGFRRFRVLEDGRGLESADGAEDAKVSILDGRRIEVRVGADRYRIPARIAASQ